MRTPKQHIQTYDSDQLSSRKADELPHLELKLVAFDADGQAEETLSAPLAPYLDNLPLSERTKSFLTPLRKDLSAAE